jgi:mono/diheme cytochrome c family protein
LKLGDTADASFHVMFKPSETQAPTPAPQVAKGEPPPPPTAPTVATVQPAAPKAPPRPAKIPLKARTLTMLFAKSDDAKAKGERLFHSTELGGVGNKVTCGHCHAKIDERAGVVLEDKFARPASSMWNSAQRGSFWGGMTDDVGKAASICQRKFMRGDGLSTQQQKELKAFLEAVSPDPAPPLNYTALYQSEQSPIRDPIGGNTVHGEDLSTRYCNVCHERGNRAAPPLATGLYEPEWIVRRVRWLEGHQSKGCPPTSMTRLPDSDLRDIVTFLSGPNAKPPIFTRKK